MPPNFFNDFGEFAGNIGGLAGNVASVATPIAALFDNDDDDAQPAPVSATPMQSVAPATKAVSGGALLGIAVLAYLLLKR